MNEQAVNERIPHRRALRPDAQAFDEIRLVTVPRYKTSGLSGDQWRVSVRVELWRKGRKIHEEYYNKMAYAVQFLAHVYHRAIDDGKAYFAGESEGEVAFCDQEGCHQPATVTYKLKKEYCPSGHATDPYEHDPRPLVRKFCQRHSQRGDAGLDDADDNYEAIEGGITPARVEDRRESAFGGTVEFKLE